MTMSDDGRLYRLAKTRTLRILDGLDDGQRAAICPSCPDWTVQDVVAHHIHIASSLASGEFHPAARDALVGEPEVRARAAATRDEWTEQGVVERRGRTVEELACEWDAIELTAKSRAVAIGRLDLTVHLADVLETFGDRRGPDTELVEATLGQYYDVVAVVRCGEVGDVPVLRCTDTGTRIGAGTCAPEIAGSAYELLRAISGRRTRAEADEHLDWGATGEPVRGAFSAYGWPTN